MKILFITHDTSRTGAPLVLLYFLQWLKEHHPEIGITVLALKGGGLNREFKNVSDKYYELSTIKVSEPTFFQEAKKRALKKMGLYKEISHLSRPQNTLIKELANEDFNIVYANTVVSIPVGHKIKCLNPKIKFVVHVHELSTVILLQLPSFRSYIPGIDSFIAVSKFVKRNLIINYSVPEDRIKICYEFTQIKKEKPLEGKSDFTVGGAGTVHWRKGSDLFIQVARYLKAHFPEIKAKFQWVGRISDFERIILEADLEKAGLKEIVSFVGEKEKPFHYFSAFDIFLLPSREDPFPLVAIEMGMLGKPIICFEKATGTAEVLEKGGGYIAPYLDIKAMAKKIVFYYENREKLSKDGKRAKELFSDFIPENQAPQILGLMESVIQYQNK